MEMQCCHFHNFEDKRGCFSIKIMLDNITDSRTLTIDKSLIGECGDVALCTCFVTARGYTKHYFEGSRRICSSGGGFSRVDWDSIARKDDGELMTDCDGLVSRLEEGCIVDDVSQAKPLSESGDFLRFGSEVHRTSSSYGEDWVDISTFTGLTLRKSSAEQACLLCRDAAMSLKI
ncbi:MAG: hypothetical protein F083_1006 [bacterium F083]|nr:MAG: hypothetical protein F083_1006 [bacterium F083]